MLLNKALDFVRGLVNITDHDIRIILVARKNIIKYNNSVWLRAWAADHLDVIMGLSDSTQLTDLVGMYLLSYITSFLSLIGGLYRDDALFVTRETFRPKLPRLK